MFKALWPAGLLLLAAHCAPGQPQPPPKAKWVAAPGLACQGQWLGELSVMYARLALEHGGTAIRGPRLGVETNFRGNDFIYAPKVGYEFAGYIVAARGTALAYIDKQRLDVRILPEAGLSFLGAANLTYGYSLPVLAYESPQLSRHRVALSLNLAKDFWYAF